MARENRGRPGKRWVMSKEPGRTAADERRWTQMARAGNGAETTKSGHSIPRLLDPSIPGAEPTTKAPRHEEKGARGAAWLRTGPVGSLEKGQELVNRHSAAADHCAKRADREFFVLRNREVDAD